MSGFDNRFLSQILEENRIGLNDIIKAVDANELSCYQSMTYLLTHSAKINMLIGLKIIASQGILGN